MLRSLVLVVIGSSCFFLPSAGRISETIEQDIWVWRVTRSRMALRPEPA
jgi:hypothetical protein